MSEVVVNRFVELAVLDDFRGLSASEQMERRECLEYLKRREIKLSKLKNLSLVASMTDDTEWQHEICAKIEKVKRGEYVD